MVEEKQKNSNYPKVLYHRSLAPVTVDNEEEHQEYGDEWAETPAAFEEKEEKAEKPKGKKKEPAPQT